MTTKRTKKTETREEILSRWIKGASQIDDRIRELIRDQWQPGCNVHMTVGEIYTANFEKFYLDELADVTDDPADDYSLRGYVVIQWDEEQGLIEIV